MAPNGALEAFFLLIQTLPSFGAERIWILRIFIFDLDPKFLDFQVPRPQSPRFPGPQISKFPNSQISRFPDFQTPPPDEFSDPNLTPLPMHPGIKYVARALAVICHSLWKPVERPPSTPRSFQERSICVIVVFAFSISATCFAPMLFILSKAQRQ